MSFAVFWKRNLAFFKLAVVSNIEYRLNFLVDIIVQPTITTVIEVLLWTSLFLTAENGKIGGFTLNYYISYVVWATFLARISSSWMYELRMIEEIESGSVNNLIVRPFSFYEYYLSQLLGYKAITTTFSLLIPIFALSWLGLPTNLLRIPLALSLVFYFLILVHSMSFIISGLAFFLNRVHYFTSTKNICLWILTGELFPIDLVPEPFRGWFLAAPFVSGVYLPTAYITGRIGIEAIGAGFVSVSIGIIITNLIGFLIWKKGLAAYAGTGA